MASKQPRNESEERALKCLLQLGISRSSITEPDKVTPSLRAEPDFLARKIAIEVKEIVPSKTQGRKIAELLKRLKRGEFISYSTPLPLSQFVRDINDAKRKFENYPDFSTILVV